MRSEQNRHIGMTVPNIGSSRHTDVPADRQFIDERACGPAAYIIGSRYNVRAAAKQFGIYGARTYDSSKKEGFIREVR